MIFIDACYRRRTPRPPIWFMRQAGRYLPEFREIRAKNSFLDVCRNPDLCVEVTMQPIRRYQVDAAIIFCDILLPLIPMGLDLTFEKGEGPVIHNPIRSMADVERLVQPDFSSDMDFLGHALQQVRGELDPQRALIGFAGAPFTLACYAIAGKLGKATDEIRQFMFSQPEAFLALIDRFTEMIIPYFKFQVASGANAVQLFDTWGGVLSAFDFQRVFLPRIARIMRETKDMNVPRIYFAKAAAHLRWFMASVGSEVIGLDWTMPIAHSRRLFGDDVAVQGNLDPAVLFADHDYIRNRTRAMIEANAGKPGHIANLGHGIHKNTPVENVAAFVDAVRAYRYSEPIL